jgi:type III secretion protein J
MMQDQFHLLRWAFLGGIIVLFAGCTMPVQHGLTERDANRIIVLLSRAKPPIQATKLQSGEGREVTWSIVVSKSDAARAIAVLQSHNMPQKPEQGFQEIYGKTGMIPTATEERAKYLMALSGELSRTIKTITGILEARVHLVIPQEKILRRPDEQIPPPNASVLLLIRSDMFNSGQKRLELSRDIQHLVGNSVERLTPQRVKVVIRDGDITTAIVDADSPIPGQAITRVLSVGVATKDANTLRMLLGGMLLMAGVFLLLFLVFFFKAASYKNQIKVTNNNSF